MNKAECAQALRSSEWCMLVFSFCIGSRHLLCVRFSVLWWVTTAHVLAFRFLLVFFVSRHSFSFSFYFLGLLRRSRIKQNSENVLAYKIFIKPQYEQSHRHQDPFAFDMKFFGHNLFRATEWYLVIHQENCVYACCLPSELEDKHQRTNG